MNKITKKQYEILSIARFVVIVLALAFLSSQMFTFLMVPSSSMEPTLNIGTFGISARNPEIEDINYEDIITFYTDNTAERGAGVAVINSMRERAKGHDVYIKRVIGLPGDVIEICFEEVGGGETEMAIFGAVIETEDPVGEGFYFVYRNGELLEEEYIRTNLSPIDASITKYWKAMEDVEGTLEKTFRLTVPEGEVFVLGDNRNNSRDSRYFGTVPIERITGKLLFHITPINLSERQLTIDEN